MKTVEKTFDSVAYMRQQRDKLSLKLGKMSKGELIEYFRNIKIQVKIRPSANWRSAHILNNLHALIILIRELIPLSILVNSEAIRNRIGT